MDFKKMTNNALYFPFISLPHDAWSVRALLYWDELSTIVPMMTLEEPDELSFFMQGLLSEGLVRPVVPGHYLHRCPNFSENFITYIDKKYMGGYFASQTPQLGYKRVHAEKLEDVPNFLCKQGLAFEVDRGWYDLREDIADDFMFYLAGCLGAMKGVDAIPLTDGKGFARRNWSNPSTDATPHLNKARQVILNNILPAPAESVTVEQLLRFRQEHGHLLPKFRYAVEKHCITVAGMSNASLRAASTVSFIDECKFELKEIEEAMRPSFGKIVFTSLLPLLSAGVSFNGEGGARDYAAGAMTLATAIYGTVSVVKEARKLSPLQPLAYVANARKFFENRSYVPT